MTSKVQTILQLSDDILEIIGNRAWKLRQHKEAQQWWVDTYGDAVKLNAAHVTTMDLEIKDKNAFIVSQLCRERNADGQLRVLDLSVDEIDMKVHEETYPQYCIDEQEITMIDDFCMRSSSRTYTALNQLPMTITMNLIAEMCDFLGSSD